MQPLALRLGLDQLVLVRVRDRVRVRLRPPPGKGYLSICRVTLLQPLYMSRLVGGSRRSDRAGLRMAREQAQACRASWRYGAGWGLAVRLTGWRRTACGMSTDMSGDKVSAPRETSCSRLAARSRAIICISIRSCSTDSCVLRCFSLSSCSSLCREMTEGVRLAGGAEKSPLRSTIAHTELGCGGGLSDRPHLFAVDLFCDIFSQAVWMDPCRSHAPPASSQVGARTSRHTYVRTYKVPKVQ